MLQKVKTNLLMTRSKSRIVFVLVAGKLALLQIRVGEKVRGSRVSASSTGAVTVTKGLLFVTRTISFFLL
jgi:hypothetical protein